MRFSVITPSFRGGPWLRLCAASVADQQVDLEHIIQDACSDDGSLQDLPRAPFLKLVVEKDQGMYDAVNRGLRRAKGEILGYLNCDEQYLPGALARVGEYFHAHPEVELAFGNVVVVDPDGGYLWHRKMLPPLLAHTWTCPLSVLTCGTFFRRRVVERALFDPRWKVCGDSVWMLELLKQKVSMGLVGEFTSAFTHTGRNLSLDPRARLEAEAFHATAPRGLRWIRPLVLAHHRLRRLARGVYHQAPFEYAIYTRGSPDRRVSWHVAKPTSRWRW